MDNKTTQRINPARTLLTEHEPLQSQKENALVMLSKKSKKKSTLMPPYSKQLPINTQEQPMPNPL